jgi:natural resistance-associated macrophage protein
MDYSDDEDDLPLKKPTRATSNYSTGTMDPEDEIVIPDSDSDGDTDEGSSTSFSWKKMWAYTGPGWLMSIAYLDPGNMEADLQGGAYCQYQLIWVLLVATSLGLVLQILAVRLGVVTGKDLATTCRQEYNKTTSMILWVMTEIAIIGSDIQEVVGSAIAFRILFGFPLWLGTLLTGLDTLTFLAFHHFGVRTLEALFGVLILTMVVCFFMNLVSQPPDAALFFTGMFVPTLDEYALVQAVGILGAIIQPHNIYLHSALVLSRRVDRTSHAKVAEANKYFTIEAAFALLISFMINAAVISVFAEGFFSNQGPMTVMFAVPPSTRVARKNRVSITSISYTETYNAIIVQQRFACAFFFLCNTPYRDTF